MSAGGSTVWELITEQAARRPDATALSGGGRTWTYGEMVEEVERVAAGLRALGLGPGDRLAVYSDNNVEMVLTWLAGARTGIVPSAVNFMFKGRELAWVLGQLEAQLLVVDPGHLDVGREALDAAGIEAPVYLVGGEDVEGTTPWIDLVSHGTDAGPAPGADDVLEVTYTSGTTSNPKGAVFTNAAYVYSLRAWNQHFGIGGDDVVYTVVPLFHASGLRYSVLSALIEGAHVHIADGFHPSTFWKEVVDLEATFFVFVETIMLILEKQEPSELERAHKVWRAVGPGQPDFLDRVEERFGFTTVQVYGMTEIGIAAGTDPRLPPEELRAIREYRRDANYVGGPVGARTEIRIVDERGNDVAEGEMGEFWMRSPGMLREYFDDSEATAEILQGGWLHSGDLGILGPGGALFFVDRQKDMIRRSGENLAPKEVEDVVLAHPKVQEVTVYPVPDPVRVQEVKALVVARPGETPTPEEIWAWCDERLADFKIPRYLEFRDTIPRNSSGRPLKAQLRQEPIEGQGRTFDRTTSALVDAP